MTDKQTDALLDLLQRALLDGARVVVKTVKATLISGVPVAVSDYRGQTEDFEKHGVGDLLPGLFRTADSVTVQLKEIARVIARVREGDTYCDLVWELEQECE